MTFKLFTTGGGAAAAETIDVTAGETLAAGEVVYLDSSNEARKSGASASTQAVLGVVTTGAAAAGTATVQYTGTVSGLTGLTANKFYGVGAGGALALSASAPTIGYATSTTELQLTGEATSIPAATWTPGEIATQLWLDAGDAASVTESGGSVSQWSDLSGNANHATQGTASAQPTYTAGVITFDGSNDFMNVPHGVLPDPTTASMVFFVGLQSDLAARGGFLSNGRFGSVRQSYTFRTSDHTLAEASVDAVWYSWGDDLNVVLSTPCTSLGLYAIDLSVTGSSVNVYQNGTLEATKSSFTGTANAGTELGILGSGNSADFLDGEIRELVVVNGEPTTAERQKIEGYLAWRHGLESSLPGAHPYASAAPTTALTAGASYQSTATGALEASTGRAIGYATGTTTMILRSQFGSTS